MVEDPAVSIPPQVLVLEKGQLLYKTLLDLCENNVSFFDSDLSEGGQKIKSSLVLMIKSLSCISPQIEDLRKVAPKFDFDEKTPGNGYRSFVSTMDACVSYCIKLSRQILVNRSSYFFRKAHYIKELDVCSQMLESLYDILCLVTTILNWSDSNNLFPLTKSQCFDEIYVKIGQINLYCFYGRSIGFQFCESLHQVMKTLAIMLASFSEVYYSDGNSMLARATNSVWHSSKYLLDPELRARRIVHCTIWASVEFCKSFWFLGEIELMNKVPNLVYSSVAVNRLINIPQDPLKITCMNGDAIDIPLPFSHLGNQPFNVRLIAKHIYQGMIEDTSTSPSKVAPVPKSNELIFHCHGGGFVAQSSRSHEMYLREWAIYLNAPVISVDYSLAPQAPFPRALEEVLYAYCWTLKNASLLGSTAEKIVFAGDSAGANLSLSLAFKCIELGVRPPDGIFLAYAPVLISFLPSPARLLSLMDPVLPIGFLSACLRAYAHPDSVENMSKYEYKLKRVSSVKINDPNLPVVTSPIEKPETVIIDVNPNHKFPSDAKNQSNITCKSTPESQEGDDKSLISSEKVISTVPFDNLPASKSKPPEEKPEETKNPIEILAAPSNLTSSSSSSNSIIYQKIQGLKDDKNELISAPSSLGGERKLPVESKESLLDLVQGEKNDDSALLDKDMIKNSVSEKNMGKTNIQVPKSGTKSEPEVSNDDTNSKLRPEFSKAVESMTTAITNVFINLTKNNGPASKVDQGIDALDVEDVSIPLEFFTVRVPEDYLLSPYLAPNELLKSLPPVKLLTTEMDPFLDDCIEFGKKLKSLNNNVTLDVLPGLPHGFLTFALINKDANEGSELCCRRIRELFDMPVEEGKETDNLDLGLTTSPQESAKKYVEQQTSSAENQSKIGESQS